VSRHCPFCAIPQDLILFETDLALIIRDQFPVSPGQTLIIPKRHIGSFFEATAEEQSEMLVLLTGPMHSYQKGIGRTVSTSASMTGSQAGRRFPTSTFT
jgi:diadenosine tetraphosphate (Ap4A) HIT family hydrolase